MTDIHVIHASGGIVYRWVKSHEPVDSHSLPKNKQPKHADQAPDTEESQQTPPSPVDTANSTPDVGDSDTANSTSDSESKDPAQSAPTTSAEISTNPADTLDSTQRVSQNPADHLDDPFDGLELCVVHRTKYDDISWPKGKLEPNESLFHAGVREIGEETGIHVGLQAHVTATEYDLAYEGKGFTKGVKPRGIRKTVDYWIAHPLSNDDAAARQRPFGPVYHADENEISDVLWMTPREARQWLTRKCDRELADEFVRRVKNGTAFATTFLLVRHGKAEGRKSWGGPDGLRPLMPRGAAAAYALSREIACFAPVDLYTSPWKRCADTIGIYAMQSGQQVIEEPRLTEDAFAADENAAWQALYDEMTHCATTARPAAVCMHRPVIGGMLDHLRQMCTDEALAKLIPKNNPYMPTGHAIALSLVATKDGPRIVDIQKVSPIVY